MKLNKQAPRTRYVEDWEYELVRQIAAESGTPYVSVFMELAVLCRARRSEAAAYRHSDISEAGLRLERLKGSEGEITRWSPRLQAAVAAAKAIHPGAPTPIGGGYLVHDKSGQPIKKNAFDSAWRRIMQKAGAAGLKEPFTFHDLKSKGYSDMKGEQFAGHKSERMHGTYNRKLREVDATE